MVKPHQIRPGGDQTPHEGARRQLTDGSRDKTLVEKADASANAQPTAPLQEPNPDPKLEPEERTPPPTLPRVPLEKGGGSHNPFYKRFSPHHPSGEDFHIQTETTTPEAPPSPTLDQSLIPLTQLKNPTHMRKTIDHPLQWKARCPLRQDFRSRPPKRPSLLPRNNKRRSPRQPSAMPTRATMNTPGLRKSSRKINIDTT